MTDVYKDENAAALARLELDKAEAAKFTQGITGAGSGKPAENPPADAKKPGEEQAPDNQEKNDAGAPPPPGDDGAAPPANASRDGKPDGTPPPSGESVPVKHIPINQYQDEKRQWKETTEQKDARIAELETALQNVAKKPEDSHSEDAAIKAYAEKNGMDEEAVRGLVAIVRSGSGLSKDDRAALDAASRATALIEEQRVFEGEWKEALPALQEQYPKATADQLAKARDVLWEASHSEGLHDKEMDYVVYKSKGKLAEIFKSPAAPTKPSDGQDGVRGPEGTNPGRGRASTLSGKDFEGKEDFADLQALSDEEHKRVLKEMSPDARLRYYRWYDDTQKGLEVNRGGRKIMLK